MRILVTGGMGYIGSVAGEELIRAGHEVIAYDNLSKGHRAAVAEGITPVQGDLADGPTLTSALQKYEIEAVFHRDINSIIESAWQWMQAHPRGYDDTVLPRTGTASGPTGA